MPLRRFIESSSIKVRLTVLLLLASSLISYLMMNLTHHTLHATLSQAENEFLHDRLHTIRAIIAEKPDYLRIIRNDVDWEEEHVQFPYYYLRIIDRSGKELVGTRGMRKQIPAGSFPPATLPGATPSADYVTKAANGRHYLLMADSITTSQPGAQGLTVQIALDVTSQVAIDKSSREKLVASMLARSVIFSVLVIVIIRRVLKPLDDMVQISEGISADQISLRANPAGLPVEVRRLASSFNRMLDRLEDAFARISCSASNMAHELRTPINNIMGEAEVALSRERSPEEYRKVLVSGVEECQRLTRLINTLLFLARAENPRDTIERVPFNVREEIEDILDFYDPQIVEKGARVACTGDGEICGDPILFRQAVSNLLRNALNYSPHGVAIAISISAQSRQVEVMVSDTGYGIAQEDLPHIFERYRRSHSSQDLAKGAGLGLSIVKAVMNMHHGTVSVVSQPGAGTSMTLRFPV